MNELDWSQLKTRCRGRLPHWEVPGMTAFLTFRLWDSLPATVIQVYNEERRILARRLAVEGPTTELVRDSMLLFSERVETLLDAGMGNCVLRQPHFSDMVMSALRFFDDDRYVVHAVSLMPNHVHIVVTLSPEWSLSQITHSWKSFTANQARRRFGHEGSLWQEETYDHIVRDEAELAYYVRYTLDNPEKAGLQNWPHVYHRLIAGTSAE